MLTYVYVYIYIHIYVYICTRMYGRFVGGSVGR